MRQALPALTAALALLTGCISRQASVTPSSAPTATGPAKDPAPPHFLLVHLSDGTALRASPADPLLQVDPGFPMPPVAWTRITALARDGDQVRVSLVDGNTIGCRAGSLRIPLLTALGPFDIPGTALQSVANLSQDPRHRLRNHLVAWLPLDETEGTTVHNKADPIVRGRLLSDGRWTIEGHRGGALTIDKAGVNGAVEFPHDAAFGSPLSSGSITMAAWLRVDMEPDGPLAIAIGDGFIPRPSSHPPNTSALVRSDETGPSPALYALVRDPGGGLRFSWGTDRDWEAKGRRIPPFARETGWTHLAVVADYWAGQCVFYVNGVPDPGVKAPPSPFMQRVSGHKGLALGRLYAVRGSPFRPSSTTESPFLGELDDVLIFDRALTSNDVAMLFNPFDADAPEPIPNAGRSRCPPTCRVEMADGSSFRGGASVKDVAWIHPELGRIRLPLASVVGMTRGRSGAPDRIEDRAGNVLMGRWEPVSLRLDTAFGRLRLPWSDIEGMFIDEEPGPARTSATPKGPDR